MKKHYLAELYPEIDAFFKSKKGIVNTQVEEFVEFLKKKYKSQSTTPISIFKLRISLQTVEKKIDPHNRNPTTIFKRPKNSKPVSKNTKAIEINRIKDLIKILDTSSEKLLAICKYLDITFTSINSKIDKEDVYRVILHFNGEPSVKNHLLEFHQKNEYSNDILETLNIINSRLLLPKRIIKFNDQETESLFTNFQALSICKGLTDAKIRKIGNKLGSKDITEEEIYIAHSHAMLALHKYGWELLMYCIQLPPLPFTNNQIDTKQVFHELDKRREVQKNPIIRLCLQNSDDDSIEKIYISFYECENIISIRTLKNKDVLFNMTRSGKVIVKSSSKIVLPTLLLFTQFSKDTKKHILHYGAITGECSICGRKLTDHKSISNKVGPVCYNYL